MTADHDAREHSGRGSGFEPGLHDAMLGWLLNDTVEERYLDTIFAAFCNRLRAHGVTVASAMLQLRTNHPQWLGIRMLWRLGCAEPLSENLEYGLLEGDAFRGSPAARILNGAEMVRVRRSDDTRDGFGFEAEHLLDAKELTDLVAFPLRYTLGQRHMVAFASDHPDGFTDPELDLLSKLVSALAVVTEVRHKNRLTRLLLDTYVGPHAGAMILDGATRRGSGVTVEAVIMMVDLRGFTRISELWPRDEVIALLNDYFDAVCCPIERNGGEVLKFIGDGLLAIFRLDQPDAGGAALRSATEARGAMRVLNAAREAKDLPPLGYGIGVNVGAVMYGNIGSRSRLDFTIIGPAVNVAARLEALTKELNANVLFSGAFASLPHVATSLIRLGSFRLRGVAQPLEVSALRDEVEDAPRAPRLSRPTAHANFEPGCRLRSRYGGHRQHDTNI